MIPHFPLPLAAGFPWQEIFPIILMILYGIAHLLGGKKGQGAAPPVPRPLPPPEQPGAPGAGGPPTSLEETLRREVEEFLRRAQGGQPPKAPVPPARAAAAPQPPRRPVDPLEQRTGASAERRPAPPSQRSKTRTTPPSSEPRRLVQRGDALSTSQSTGAAATEANARASAPLGAGVAQHVNEHLASTRALAQHAQGLGQQVAQADDKLDQHLREKFVHQVGALQPQGTGVQIRARSISPVAKELFELLSKPGGARQLVIANEILRSPVDRL